ncbi:hypothetical protein [Streptomyces phaeochromogenes]|uniref:hypothetical protein n=1 Tax=Streptomyces phaeochromogenes TaxID=1923 RepID=UPI002DD964E9|nr:hypothetical protein [Streptomyces phaeochromogenes]WRZ34720.1 hypothetical protein OG931_46790 [Streptomyces phaeochromogenes]
MALADRFLTLGRDVHSGEVLARGGDREAHSILQRTGFVPVVRLHETYHRLPVGLDQAEEKRLATRAVARLRAVKYGVKADDAFDTEMREPHYLPLGSQVAHLAERIREATTSDEVADVLTELTASHDGVIIALGEVFAATAAFYQDLGQPPDPHTAKRLQYLAEHRLTVLWSDLAHMRNDLADRHQDHPQRRARTADIGPDEREASAVCACPPPQPPLATSPVAVPAPHTPTHPRR